jgi:prophage regulatory protein
MSMARTWPYTCPGGEQHGGLTKRSKCAPITPGIDEGAGSAEKNSKNTPLKLYGVISMYHTSQFVPLKTVIEFTSLSKSTIYRRMASGEFPKCVNLGGSCRRWRQTDIEAWASSVK